MDIFYQNSESYSLLTNMFLNDKNLYFSLLPQELTLNILKIFFLKSMFYHYFESFLFKKHKWSLNGLLRGEKANRRHESA